MALVSVLLHVYFTWVLHTGCVRYFRGRVRIRHLVDYTSRFAIERKWNLSNTVKTFVKHCKFSDRATPQLTAFAIALATGVKGRDWLGEGWPAQELFQLEGL